MRKWTHPRFTTGVEQLEARTLLSGQIFVASISQGAVEEFSTTGAAIQNPLIAGLLIPDALAVSGSDLFVVSGSATGSVAEYTTTGTVVNPALVSALSLPAGIAIANGDIFVTDGGSGTVGEYTTSGEVVNAALITGLNSPRGIVVSGSDLYVQDQGTGVVNEYTTSGAVVAAPLISGLGAGALALSGSSLLIANTSAGTVGEYDGTTGIAINPTLISGIDSPFAIAVDGAKILLSTLSGVDEYTTSGAPVAAPLADAGNKSIAIAVADSTPAPAGVPDPTFNDGAPVGINFAAQASAVTSTGATLLAGLVTDANGGTTAALEQLTPAGTIDSGFGSNGVVTDALTDTEAFYSVVTESGGEIVAAGTGNHDLLLTGYNADGSVDTSFGTGGRDAIPIASASSASAYGSTTDSNGNLILVGSADGQFVIDRVSPTGQQDTMFNGGTPLVFGNAADGDVLGKVAVESNGDIIATGASAGKVVLVRLTPSGALDSTFGVGGLLTVDGLSAPDLLGKPDFTQGLAIDSQNRILVANTNAAGDFVAARLTPGGYLDSTFGAGGIVTSNFGGTDDADFICVQPDGSQILIAGTTTINGSTNAIIAAYSQTGILDTNFGSGGTETLGTGAAATPNELQSLRPVIHPRAQGIGSIISQVYGTYDHGKVTVGKSTNAPAESSGVVQRFTAPAPTDTPLQSGTLGATVATRLPAAVIGGAKSKTVVPVTLKNSGNELILGPVTVTVFFSLGQSLGSATQLATISSKLRLRALAHAVVHLHIPIIPVLPAGNYYLIVEVNAPDGTSTGIAGPTTALSPPFAEVALSGVTGQSKPLAPGKPTAVSFKLQNQGNILASAKVELTITASPDNTAADGQKLAEIPWKLVLRPGQLRQFRLPLRLPKSVAAGQYYFIVELNLAALTDIVVPDISAFSDSTITVT